MSKILIKIGTHVLRADDGSLNTAVLNNIVEQIHTLRESGAEVTLISSGAVSAGHNALSSQLPSFSDDTQRKQVLSAIGQTYLMHTYQELFAQHATLVGQVLITKMDFSNDEHTANLKRCLEGLHTQGVIPIINENDSTAIAELMFTDNDEIASMLVTTLGADELIICTNVDGVFTGDPNASDSQLLKNITAHEDMTPYIQSTTSSFGRGGMHTKVSIAQALAKQGIVVKILNGKNKDAIITAATTGNIGTTVLPDNLN
jgi:glutamate 5-kinase